MEVYTGYFSSPVGYLQFTTSETKLLSLQFAEKRQKGADAESGILPKESAPARLHQQIQTQLKEYFQGKRREFTIPLSLEGTPFQEKVWHALLEIPYGETCSYLEIARAVGNPKACRAVGMANNRNPIAILVPCHRVVGADGSLTGYAGGLTRKAYLLKLERGNVNETDVTAGRHHHV